MRYESADAAVRRYVELRHTLSAPRGARLMVGMGRSYAPCCPRCAHDRRFVGRHGIARCARCGATWPVEEVEVLRGSVQVTPRRGGREVALGELGMLGRVLDRVPCWPRRALLVYAGLGVPYSRVYEEVRSRWPRAPEHGCVWWRQRVEDGRRGVESRLRRAGWL